MTTLIHSGQDWSFSLIDDVYNAIDRIWKKKYGLPIYPNQVEVISSEQMLDAYCITPDHKLLRKDLRWINADNIVVGDTVLGFDEYGPHRRYRAAIVTNKEYDKKEVFEVTLSSGKVFKVTGNHLWLTRVNKGKACILKWVSTRDLRTINNSDGYFPTYIPKVMNVWEEETDKSAGWLAGIFDGEGNILKSGLGKLSIAQNEGQTLEKIKSLITQKGFQFLQCKKPTTSSCYGIDILGDVTTRMEFLGRIRPERLISKLDFNALDTFYTSRQEQEYVVSVKCIGITKIVKISTSTSTFICDGYPMHNSAVGMPLMYTHWSYGEQFIREQEAYKRGYMGLAYEIVINSDPCIAYLMEENTMLMQALVTAHASFGHNTFFKNNYLFKQWTDASSIIDYLTFAKKFIAECEEKYGIDEVENILDAAHALQRYGVDKYKRPPRLSSTQEENLRKERDAYIQSQLNELWSTIPLTKEQSKKTEEEKFPKEPQENLLYFIEKNAPRMESWKREIIRIVRKVAQYFYPQGQTKLMNEGSATYFHYKLIHDLYDEGILDDGALLEFYDNHTAVVRQLDYDHKHYSGINPYALGFAMYRDIERVATEPTEEDREWFGKQDWVGCGDSIKAIKFAIQGFKDESFIQQFLSPKIMRDFKMFALHDDEADPKYLIAGIHNSQGYKMIRDSLAKQYNFGYMVPDIQVFDVNRWGDRTLTLRHYMVNRKPLEAESTTETLKYVAFLWGYNVKLESVDEAQNIRASYEVQENETLLDVFLDDGSKK